MFFFFVLARFQTTATGELLLIAPLAISEYLLLGAVSVHLLTAGACCLQVALFLKAAQWFFYPWLLDAMEAPVPISAQLHSSTLVVIGFYLFFRFQVLFLLAPVCLMLNIVAGFITSVGASVLGFFQDDGKKLLACSTASQLGYVLVALGLGLDVEALLLLAFCCCNKAATFVWFGLLMRRAGGVSDFRYLAGQGLTWVEHAGLLVSLGNFTIIPGGFCWHVKGLFFAGLLERDTIGVSCGLALLGLTWFLSSLYLMALYGVLFFGSRRGQKLSSGGVVLGGPSWGWLNPRTVVGGRGVWPTRWLLYALQGVLIWYGGGLGLLSCDAAWAGSMYGWGLGYY